MGDAVRVLHVDDDPAFLDLTAELLPRADGGIDVVTATGASEGLERLDEAEIDCVVSDYEMPGRSGIEFLEAVRERHDDLPFILFTGKGSEEVASDAISAGVTDYLQKEPGADQYALLANRIRNAVEATAARERSRRRKREYRTLIDSSPVSILVVDEDIDVLYLNPTAAETLGIDDPEEVVGTSALDFLHPGDYDGGVERAEQVFAEREPIEPREYRILTTDGRTRHVQGNVVPVTFEDEQAVQIVFTDITEQKEREAALKQERRRFSALFENFPEPTLVYAYEDCEPVVRDVNEAFIRTFGYEADEAVGTPVDDLVVPPEKREEAQQIDEQVQAGEPVDAELRRQAADGQRWFNFRNAAVSGVDDIDGYAIYTDIQERVRKEEQFKLLHDGTRELLSADDADDVAETVATVAKEILGYEYTMVRFPDEDEERLRPIAWTEEVAAVLGDRPHYPIDGANPHARAYRQQAPVVYDDVRVAEDGKDRDPIRSAMYLPVGGHGVVTICDPGVGAFDLSDVEIASILTANAEAALDRLEHEREIRRVKERFQAFVEHASDVITLLDRDGVVEYQSPAAERVIGRDSAEMVGRNVFELIHPDDRSRVLEQFQGIVDRDGPDLEPVTVEFRFEHADGSWIWLESVGSGLTAGSQDGYVIVSREITDRKRREQELERYETIVEIAGDGVYTLDAEGRITFANESLAEISGYDREELLGEPASLLMTDDDLEAGVEAIQSLLTTDETEATFEIDLCTRDGGRIPCELNVALLPSDDGFRGTVGVGRVIAERKERERQLERERRRFSALFENFPEPTVAYAFEDGTSVVRDVNEAFTETFGYDAAESLGHPIEDLIVPDDRHEEADRIGERIRAGELVNAELRREAADGERDFRFRNIPCPGGQNVDGFAVYADITERVERERQLQRQNERLDEFAGVVSHDLRNPLNVAQARLELAAMDADSEHLADVDEALDRIEAVLDDTLELARHGRTVLDREEIDLRTLAEASWNSVEPEAATLDVVDDATLLGNRGRLRQVFENLFRNSVEHGSTSPDSQARQDAGSANASDPPVADAPDDAVEHGSTSSRPEADDARGVTIRVGTIGTDGIYVADDGPGIPEADREDVFEPGFTADEGGTGFGLTIVRDVVDAHGWDVTVTESADGGARFEITGIETA